jgi:hypothetical protein
VRINLTDSESCAIDLIVIGGAGHQIALITINTFLQYYSTAFKIHHSPLSVSA